MTEFSARGDRQNNPQPEKKRNGRGRKLAIIGGVVVALLAVGGGAFAYHEKQITNYTALSPKSKKMKSVHIDNGESASAIAKQLQKEGIIRSSDAFMNYVGDHNVSQLLSGYYQLSPSMTVGTVAKKVAKGGSPYPINSHNAVTVREGENAESIAADVAQHSKFTKDEFLKALNDQAFLGRLKEAYPGLLDSAISAKDVRYHLEGYLYPATYNLKGMTNVNQVINQMVAKSYSEYQPYFDQIKKSGMTVQQVMTLASLVEREGVDQTSRGIIAGVFLNRIDINMPLASDVAVKYALDTNKPNLSNKDVQVDSPFNLYKNPGYGPGPFDSPSVDSVSAVLNPLDRDKGYLYFVANLQTGKIYYSKTYDDQLNNTSKVQNANDAVGSSASSNSSSK